MHAIFLDIETTGLSPIQHCILQIAFKLIDLKDGAQLDYYEAIIQQPRELWKKRDPLSTSINGFTWSAVEKGKEQSVVASEVIHFFEKWQIKRGQTLYICQNPAFDRTFFAQLIDPLIQEEKKWPYHWLDLASMYWVIQVNDFRKRRESFPEKFNLSKNAIAEHYGLPAETYPHKAMNGVDHLILCYEKMVGFDVF